MALQKHIIGKQIVDIRQSSGSNIFELQKQMAACVRGVLIPAMELEFDACVSASEVLKLTHLEIDLGFIHANKLDNPSYLKDLANQLRTKIKEALTNRLKNATTLTIELHGFEQWLFFIEHGRLPWPVVRIQDNWEQSVLESLAGNIRAIEQLKALWQKSKYAQWRLTQQHSEKFLAALLGAISGERQDTLPSLLTTIWKAVHSLKQIERAETVERAWREQCWQLLIQILLGHRKKYNHGQLAVILMYLQIFEGKVENPLASIKSAFKHAVGLMNIIYTSGEQKVFQALQETQNILANERLTIFSKNHFQSPNNEWLNINKQIHYDGGLVEKDGLALTHAGVVLIHVFLPHLFRNLNLLENDAFKNDACRHLAIHLVHYIATGNLEPSEYQLSLEKVLCGHPLHIPIPRFVCLEKDEIEEADQMLQVAIDRWESLGHASPEGLREGFFEREGKLNRKNGEGWRLQVVQNTLDVLLDKLPWNLSIVKLPWMKEQVHVVWR